MLRSKIHDYIDLPVYLRDYSEGLTLLEETASVTTNVLHGLRRENDYNHEVLVTRLINALDSIDDEKRVPQEVKLAYVDTPQEVIDLYRKQADIKGKQSAEHALLLSKTNDGRRKSALKLLAWQNEVDHIWDMITTWKETLELPTAQNNMEMKRKRKNSLQVQISKLKKRIRENPTSIDKPEWTKKLNTLDKERNLL